MPGADAELVAPLDPVEKAVELALEHRPAEALDLVDRCEDQAGAGLIGRLFRRRPRLDKARVRIIQITANRLAQADDRDEGLKAAMALVMRVRSEQWVDLSLLEVAREFQDVGPLQQTQVTSGSRKLRCLLEIVRADEVFEFGEPVDEKRRAELVDAVLSDVRPARAALIRARVRRLS